MTQSNPSQKEEINNSPTSPNGLDEKVIRTATWAAAFLAFVSLILFVYAITSVNFHDWEDYVLVGFPVLLAGTSLAGIFLMRRGRLALGSGIVFNLNLLVPLLLVLILTGTFWSALLYGVVSSVLLIWRALPRRSWRWSIITASAVMILVVITNFIDPSGRLTPPAEFDIFFALVVTGLTIAFLFQAIQYAWTGNLRGKLLSAFGILVLLALVVGFVANVGLNNVQTGYEHAIEDGGELRAISLTLSNNLLTTRRHEKDFILRWQDQGFGTAYTNYAIPHHETVDKMLSNINALSSFAPTVGKSFGDIYPQTQYEIDIAVLRESTILYERNFKRMVQLIQEKGFQDSGLEGRFRDDVHNIEDRIYGREGLESLVITMLQIRRHEKDYLLRGDQTYIDQTHQSVADLKEQIASSNILETAEKMELAALADQYVVSFDALVEKDIQIAATVKAFQDATFTLEPIVEKLTTTGLEMSQFDAATARTSTTQTLQFSSITLVAALLAAIFLSGILSQQITRPAVQLTNTAREIAAGNFDVHADVTSSDEIGTLAQTFNTMTERLGVAFEDVRRRSLQVQTAAEVSRRLSAVTNPHQLAVEVVEQVQRAFDYYYAQIYLLDEAGENLVLTGGTGEAGAAMLARKHSVQKGRGLVGRAADTNRSVLVADVSQEEGWLPNEMLPETKTEAAVPISFAGQVFGVLDVQHSVVNGLTVDDVTLLESLAGQAAISLQNARSYEQSRRQAEFESLTNVIGRRIQRTTTIEETLQTAIRELGTAIGASRVKAKIQPASKAVSTEPASAE